MSIENVVRFVKEYFKQFTMSTDNAAIIVDQNNDNSISDSGGDGGYGNDIDDDVLQQSAYNTIVEFGLKDNVSSYD